MNIHNEFHINSSKLGVRMDKIRVANLYGADFINTNKTKRYILTNSMYFQMIKYYRCCNKNGISQKRVTQKLPV